MSNRLTFSLASLILMFAFVAMPAMAAQLSATWTTDVNGDGTADDSGWNVTLMYATAPAATDTLPEVNGSTETYDPASPDGTATSFVLDLEPTNPGEDLDVTIEGFRRVTLINGRNLGATEIYQPKLKSITAPMYVKGVFNATITFEAEADAVTGPPAVAAIGPSNGLKMSDIAVTNGTVLSVSGGPATYTASINPTTAGATAVVITLPEDTTGSNTTVFPRQAPAMASDAMASVTYDITAPTVTAGSPDTIPVNNRKPAPPSNGQWGAVPFDITFMVADETDGSMINASSINNMSFSAIPDVLSFDDVGRTATDGQYIVTVSVKNSATVEAGDEVEVLVTVSDMAGNETTGRAALVTLAAHTAGTVDATFTSATPATGGSVAQGGTIALVFGTDPGTVTVTAPAMGVTVSGTGTMQTLTIAADQAEGALSITLTWGTSGTTTLAYTITETDTDDLTAELTALTVPAESYVLLVHDEGFEPTFVLPSNATTMPWADMPNLEKLLYSGGSLVLTRAAAPQLDPDGAGTGVARDAAVRDLIITEVMWARNTAEIGTSEEAQHQWIEIYNPLKVAVDGVTVATKPARPALTAPTGEVLLDRLSNAVGNGWQLSGLGQDGYDDGNAETSSTDFISMYRKERGKNGHTKGHWAQSTEVYFSGHKGTPGAKERPTGATVSQTSFDVGPVIFNEISNRSDGDYEWFELRNKSDSEQNLKNREIRIVTVVGEDVSLFQFGDKDAKIPAGGVLLCVFTDPRDDDDHPVATGWNIDKGAGDQINGVNDGSDASKRYTPRYIVIKDNDKRVYNEAALGDEGFPAEFVLILRSRRHNDDVGKDTNIWDIAGYDTSLKVPAEDAGFTNLWPLKGAVRSAQLSNNKWDVGTVHRRQKDNVWGTSSTNYGRNDGNHADDTAFRNVGWTGIGYRRNAAQGNENGGTPGYPNNALQSNETQAGADPVVITEVMYATGSRSNIPQWIELYNSSKTVGVNLDGWQLTIVNHDQDVGGGTYAGDLSKNYAISGKIPPGQTFLLVAYPGRNESNLPSERIHSLRSNRGELILSQYGFELTLKSKGKDNKEENRKTADVVGNLADVADARVRNNPQSYTDPAWALPMGTNDDGDRISIVRVSMADGSPVDGQTQSAWASFDMSAQFTATLDSTSYGHGTDLSSPGHTVGGVLPVSLSKFRPERMKDTGQIVVRWITESELNNAGFNILRGEKLDGEFTKINTKLIAGQGTTSERTTYSFPDTSAKPNVVYYYQIQDVSLEGQVNTLAITHLRGNVSAAGKLTTTWGELKALQ